MTRNNPETLIFGAGLAGLAAGHVLTRAGLPLEVIEASDSVGGLARTIEHDGFRFDLGGHRFLTGNKAIETFVSDLLGNEILDAPRKSKILLRGRYFDYPLKPANALFGLGIPTTLRLLAGYCVQKLRTRFRPAPVVSLEDWVVARFGRPMFDLYFRDYSEKVWGLPCSEISAEWVAKRIAGLSLWEAVKNAFSRQSGTDIATLADRFLYPPLGIGQISERLRQTIEWRNPVRTDTRIIRIDHDRGTIKSIMVRSKEEVQDIPAHEIISTIPLTNLVRMLHPAPPAAVLEAAGGLLFRDLIVVTVMLNREQVTDLSWMYLPEKGITLGRIHEPRNWSTCMAPEGKTHLVAEYFCFQDDDIWKASDGELTDRTVKELSGLGLFTPEEVIGSHVVRVPRAYPVLDIGYRRKHEQVMNYLSGFRNLQVAGRGGSFQYLNMDHAIESGMDAAAAILGKKNSSYGCTRKHDTHALHSR
jgi:protoporphyrinogen oxidase